jgi:hypothetical protein
VFGMIVVQEIGICHNHKVFAIVVSGVWIPQIISNIIKKARRIPTLSFVVISSLHQAFFMVR